MEKIVSHFPMLISASVVSHGQMDLIVGLMQDIQSCCTGMSIEFILTLNLDEPLTIRELDFFYPIRVIRNSTPKGFGANHNQAFKQAQGQYFCIINPDIRFEVNPFPDLIECLKDTRTGVVAPSVLGRSGELEDSVRRFPTPKIILFKALQLPQPADYVLTHQTVAPDWVAGMFMLFPHHVFGQLNGFDERYFLYYEDVDLCGRLHLAGWHVLVCTSSRVVHHAQRHSHRSFKYMRWHIGSMLRFFMSSVYRQLRQRHSL